MAIHLPKITQPNKSSITPCHINLLSTSILSSRPRLGLRKPKRQKKISLSVIRSGTEIKTYLIRNNCSHYTTMCGTENPYGVYIFPLLTNKSKSTPSHQQTRLHICMYAFWMHLQHSKGLKRIFITLKALPL